MTLTPQQLAAIRRQRRAAEAMAEDRFQHRVAELLGLAEDDSSVLPDPVQVGWRQAELPGGASWVYCLTCGHPRSTVNHVPVYAQSYHATKPCVVCGRRLDRSPV